MGTPPKASIGDGATSRWVFPGHRFPVIRRPRQRKPWTMDGGGKPLQSYGARGGAVDDDERWSGHLGSDDDHRSKGCDHWRRRICALVWTRDQLG